MTKKKFVDYASVLRKRAQSQEQHDDKALDYLQHKNQINLNRWLMKRGKTSHDHGGS